MRIKATQSNLRRMVTLAMFVVLFSPLTVLSSLFSLPCSLFVGSARAQTFTSRIQEKGGEREGKLTITHSAAIDLLVNGKQTPTSPAQPASKETPKKQEPLKTESKKDDTKKSDAKRTETKKPETKTAEQERREDQQAEQARQEKARQEREKARREAAQAEKNRREAAKNPGKDANDKRNTPNTVEGEQTNEDNTSPLDTRKKVMRNSYRVTGYRVQAYAGGNQRKDRQKAEQVGNDIKANYPEEPIYVHFYSPRWICRVGNYRTYEEAHQMLLNVRKLGYSSATIVKGKISIQY